MMGWILIFVLAASPWIQAQKKESFDSNEKNVFPTVAEPPIRNVNFDKLRQNIQNSFPTNINGDQTNPSIVQPLPFGSSLTSIRRVPNDHSSDLSAGQLQSSESHLNIENQKPSFIDSKPFKSTKISISAPINNRPLSSPSNQHTETDENLNRPSIVHFRNFPIADLNPAVQGANIKVNKHAEGIYDIANFSHKAPPNSSPIAAIDGNQLSDLINKKFDYIVTNLTSAGYLNGVDAVNKNILKNLSNSFTDFIEKTLHFHSLNKNGITLSQEKILDDGTEKVIQQFKQQHGSSSDSTSSAESLHSEAKNMDTGVTSKGPKTSKIRKISRPNSRASKSDDDSSSSADQTGEDERTDQQIYQTPPALFLPLLQATEEVIPVRAFPVNTPHAPDELLHSQISNSEDHMGSKNTMHASSPNLSLSASDNTQEPKLTGSNEEISEFDTRKRILFFNQSHSASNVDRLHASASTLSSVAESDTHESRLSGSKEESTEFNVRRILPQNQRPNVVSHSHLDRIDIIDQRSVDNQSSLSSETTPISIDSKVITSIKSDSGEDGEENIKHLGFIQVTPTTTLNPLEELGSASLVTVPFYDSRRRTTTDEQLAASPPGFQPSSTSDENAESGQSVPSQRPLIDVPLIGRATEPTESPDAVDATKFPTPPDWNSFPHNETTSDQEHGDETTSPTYETGDNITAGNSFTSTIDVAFKVETEEGELGNTTATGMPTTLVDDEHILTVTNNNATIDTEISTMNPDQMQTDNNSLITMTPTGETLESVSMVTVTIENSTSNYSELVESGTGTTIEMTMEQQNISMIMSTESSTSNYSELVESGTGTTMETTMTQQNISEIDNTATTVIFASNTTLSEQVSTNGSIAQQLSSTYESSVTSSTTAQTQLENVTEESGFVNTTYSISTIEPSEGGQNLTEQPSTESGMPINSTESSILSTVTTFTENQTRGSALWRLKLTDLVWDSSLNDKLSWQYRKVYESVFPDLKEIFKEILQTNYAGTSIERFSAGSVIVIGKTESFEKIDSAQFIDNLEKQLKNRNFKLGGHDVDADTINVDLPGGSAPQIAENPVKSGGMPGYVIAIIVAAVLLLAAVLVGAYFIRRYRAQRLRENSYMVDEDTMTGAAKTLQNNSQQPPPRPSRIGGPSNGQHNGGGGGPRSESYATVNMYEMKDNPVASSQNATNNAHTNYGYLGEAVAPPRSSQNGRA